MAFTAVMMARQSMTEFMNHFYQEKSTGQHHHVLGCCDLAETRQFGHQLSGPCQYQDGNDKHKQSGRRSELRVKNPADPGIQKPENSTGINTPKTVTDQRKEFAPNTGRFLLCGLLCQQLPITNGV